MQQMNHVKSLAMLLMQPAIAALPPQVSLGAALEAEATHSQQLGIAVMLGKFAPLVHHAQPQPTPPLLRVLLVPVKTPG